jgi:hypothetical protein
MNDRVALLENTFKGNVINDIITENYIRENVRYIHNFNRHNNYIPDIFENENTGHCIAYCLAEHEIIFGVTFCKDQYVKAIGRKHSLIRLLDEKSRYSLLYKDFIELITEKECPIPVTMIFSKHFMLENLNFYSFSSSIIRMTLTYYLLNKCEHEPYANVCKTKISEEVVKSTITKSESLGLWGTIKKLFE